MARQASYAIEDEGQAISALHAQTAARYADRDAARMRELDRIIRTGAHCRYCGRKLSDKSLGAHPGICGTAICRRRAESMIRYGRKKEIKHHAGDQER
jgi:hypothetical protein